MVIPPFSLITALRIKFGIGAFDQLGTVIKPFGTRALIVTGQHSMKQATKSARLTRSLEQEQIAFELYEVPAEPSPQIIDDAVVKFADHKIAVVVAIGGGSVIDAGKAISAMLPLSCPIEPYLEGRGSAVHPGTKIPFIALPTTAGTGSEMTKNAVITQRGAAGFKASLRHDNFVPDLAIIDPTLALEAPAALLSACAMDALSQLIESYLSTAATPITDALCLSALQATLPNLLASCGTAKDDLAVRAQMAYAAMISGFTLAHAGLGTVHGIAGPLGARYRVPHGVICGSLLPAWLRVTTSYLASDQHRVTLHKLHNIAALMPGHPQHTPSQLEHLFTSLEHWNQQLGMARLADYQIDSEAAVALAAKSSNKNNPVNLPKEAIAAIIEQSL